MVDLSEFGIVSDVEFYDYERIEKLNEKRNKQKFKIHKKIISAKEKGNQKALEEALDEFRKHCEVDDVLKSKARRAGYFWT